MAVPIPCPHCKKSIGLSRTTLGKKIKCPSCGRSFVAGGDPDEPPELVAPVTPPEVAPSPTAVRKTKRSAPRAARKQGALRFLVFLLGLIGAAGAGLLASQLLASVRPGLAMLKFDVEPLNPYLNPYLKDASLAGESLHVRTMAAYVLAAAAVLALLGVLLALGGRGFIPGLFFFAAFGAPLILNDRSYVFTIPLVGAGVMSLALGGVRRGSGLRTLLEFVGAVLAGVMLMAAGMTKFQPPPGLPGPPVVQPGNGETPPTPTPPKYTPEQIRDAKPDFTLSALEVSEEYHKDPAAARQKYDGKVLEVSGVVDGCRSDAGNSMLMLEGKKGADPSTVSCVMQEKECWARHGRGQKVKLKGGFVGGNGPGLAETVVLESDPNPTPLYVAEMLAGQFESDPGALLERFGDRNVIVEGEVLKVDSSEGARTVSLKGTSRTAVRCQFLDPNTDAKAGEKLRVFGLLSNGLSDKEPTLTSCLRVTVPTTAQPPTPPPGPYDATIKDAAKAAAMIDKAGADVKLVPADFTIAGIALTMMVPEGATVKKVENEVEVRGGPTFSFNIKPGRSNLAAAQKYWLADRDAPTAAFLIATDNVVLRTVRVKRNGIWKTEPTFLSTQTLGHVDVRVFDRGEPFTIPDCLLMLRCAATLKLKSGYQPPKDLEALKSSGVMATRDGTKLSIRTDVEFTDAAMPYLVKFAGDAEGLILWSPLTDQGLEQVGKFPKLRRLEFYGADGDPFSVDGTALKGVKNLKALEYLSISQAMLSDSSLLNLRPLITLKSLSLNEAPITGSGFRLLKGLRITSLSLDSTHIDDANLKNIGAFVNLESLSLDYTKISDAGMGNLIGLKKLKDFSIMWTPVTDAGLQQLKELSALTTLNLWGTKVGDPGLSVLKTLPKLEDLTLSETAITDEGLRNLAGAPALKSLALEKTAITDAGIDHLKNIKTLRTLWLKGTKVSEAKIAELEKAGISVR